MNRKIRFLSFVFALFLTSVLGTGGAFAITCSSGQYLAWSGYNCLSCGQLGWHYNSNYSTIYHYNCPNGASSPTCKSGYTLVYSRVSSTSERREYGYYCCPTADIFSGPDGRQYCISQTEGDGVMDNGAYLSGGVYTCPSGYERTAKIHGGWGNTGSGAVRVTFDHPVWMCCPTGHTFYGPDGTTKYCCDDSQYMKTYNSSYAPVQSCEENSNGTYNFKCTANNGTFRGAVINNTSYPTSTTPWSGSFWSCDDVLYFPNGGDTPYSGSSPAGITSSNYTRTCYSPKKNSSGKVTGYNTNVNGAAMDGTSFTKCQVDVTLTGKTGCTNNQVKTKYTLDPNGTYISGTPTAESLYDLTAGKFFSSSNYSTHTSADWLVKGYDFTAQAGYKKVTSGTNAGSCTACTGQTYSTANNNSTSCSSVPSNSTATSDHTWFNCDIGYYNYNWVCTRCPYYTLSKPYHDAYGGGVNDATYHNYTMVNGTTSAAGATSVNDCYAPQLMLEDSNGHYLVSNCPFVGSVTDQYYLKLNVQCMSQANIDWANVLGDRSGKPCWYVSNQSECVSEFLDGYFTLYGDYLLFNPYTGDSGLTGRQELLTQLFEWLYSVSYYNVGNFKGCIDSSSDYSVGQWNP